MTRTKRVLIWCSPLFCWFGFHQAGEEKERVATNCFVAVETHCVGCKRRLTKRYRPTTLDEVMRRRA